MHESDPKSIRDQEGIQRDEDMALSTFAPGCEIVKDKKVFKSVGFVDFDFYHSPPKRKPGLAPIKNSCLYLCPACGFSELRRSAEKLASCPVCSNTGLKAFGNASAPLGYLAGKYPEDFNGNYEWTPNKTETHIDNEASKIELQQVAGANLLLGNNKAPRQGMVRAIGANLGKRFNVAKSKTRGDPAEYCLDALSASEAFERKACDESTARNVVLVSTKVTGVLEIALADANAALNLTPDFSAFSSNIEVIKSAMLSWGMMLRSCMTDFLDVDSRELNVNFFFTQKDGRPRPVLYFSETLENGAGYASHIAEVARQKPDVFRSAILDALLPGGDMHERLTAPPHLDECDSSCYDCLRDYGNQDIHGLLNWRLGLDIAQVASNASYVPSLKEAHWESIRLSCLRQIKEAEGLPERACKDCSEFLSFKKGGQAALVVHPLLSRARIEEYKRRIDGGGSCLCQSITTTYKLMRLPAVGSR